MSCVLGDDELMAVLGGLSVQDRLSSCSLVSKQFRRAAVAATPTAKLSTSTVNGRSFLSYSNHHGKHISSLDVVPTSVDAAHTKEHSWPLPIKILEYLPHLKVMHLSSYTRVHDLFWQYLSNMPCLEELQVTLYYKTSPQKISTALVAATSLKQLSLDAVTPTAPCGDTFPFTLETIPELQQLTQLEQLSLTATAVQPELLLHLTRLEDLRLAGQLHEGNHAALLTVLSTLTRLTKLQLRIESSWQREVGFQPDASYAAITSSSKLHHLQLCMGLPSSAWAAVFHAELRLPELTYLGLNSSSSSYISGSNTPPFSCRHMLGLCQLTGLQTLSLAGFELCASSLLALPNLRRLQLEDVVPASGPDGLMDVLPQMENVVHLEKKLRQQQ